jgi:hypothetical protein
MQDSRFGKVIIAVAVLVVVMGAVMHFSGPPAENTAMPLPAASKKENPAPSQKFSQRLETPVPHVKAALETPANAAAGPQLLREKVEEYLARNNRNAASLLAALHALDNTNYLNEAAANFPNDPQVQWTILARDAYPEERRKWLELFKAGSPDNSLANYLSAADHFKTGQSDPALNELLEASDKQQFKDYAMEARLSEEELSRASGRTPLESIHIAGWATDVLPGLASLKGLARSIGDTHKQYLDAGDAASANNLAQLELTLANRLSTGEAGKLLINQLVGISIEAMTLKQLEQNIAYEFLGGKTPTLRQEELKQQKESLNQVARSLSSLYWTLNEAEMLGFSDRVKVYGEVEATHWLQQHQGTNVPGQNR